MMGKKLLTLAFLLTWNLSAKPGPPPPSWHQVKDCPTILIVKVKSWAWAGRKPSDRSMDSAECEVMEALRGDKALVASTLTIYRDGMRFGSRCGPRMDPPYVLPQHSRDEVAIVLATDVKQGACYVVGSQYGWVPCNPKNLAAVRMLLDGQVPEMDFRDMLRY